MRTLSPQEIQAVSGSATAASGEQKTLPTWYVYISLIVLALLGKSPPLF